VTPDFRCNFRQKMFNLYWFLSDKEIYELRILLQNVIGRYFEQKYYIGRYYLLLNLHRYYQDKRFIFKSKSSILDSKQIDKCIGISFTMMCVIF